MHYCPMENSKDTDRIVVGVDGSQHSITALRYAASLSHALDAPVEAVAVWSYPPLIEPYVVMEWTPDEIAKEALDGAIHSAFGDHPPDRLTRHLLPGSPAQTLIELSKSCGLLVLGSRGHGGFVGMLLGSVSAACAEHAHCPVLIVHGNAHLPGANSAE